MATNPIANPKEQAYDEHINPLMAQIIDICKEHKIALLAEFVFCRKGCACHDGEGCGCTTTLLTDEYGPSDGQLAGLKAIRAAAEPPMLAFTITARGRNK